MTNPPPYTASGSDDTVCCISMHKDDILRLTSCPQDVVTAIENVVEKYWLSGLKYTMPYGPSIEIKLQDDPWQKDHPETRVLMCNLLRVMAEHGWRLLTGVDMSNKSISMNSLYFERAAPATDVKIFALQPFLMDRLNVVGAAAGAHTIVRQCIEATWSKKAITAEVFNSTHNSMRFTIDGVPWFASGEETMYPRLFVAKVVARLSARGFKLYGAITQSFSGNLDCASMDTLYFRRADDTF